MYGDFAQNDEFAVHFYIIYSLPRAADQWSALRRGGDFAYPVGPIIDRPFFSLRAAIILVFRPFCGIVADVLVFHKKIVLVAHNMIVVPVLPDGFSKLFGYGPFQLFYDTVKRRRAVFLDLQKNMDMIRHNHVLFNGNGRIAQRDLANTSIQNSSGLRQGQCGRTISGSPYGDFRQNRTSVFGTKRYEIDTRRTVIISYKTIRFSRRIRVTHSRLLSRPTNGRPYGEAEISHTPQGRSSIGRGLRFASREGRPTSGRPYGGAEISHTPQGRSSIGRGLRFASREGRPTNGRPYGGLTT